MDSIIWWLHAHVARAAAEYASTHPEKAAAITALPYAITAAIYAWLGLTLWLGLQRQMLYFRGISPARAHLEQLSREVDAVARIESATRSRNAPEQHADGNWYANTYDANTGEVVGKKKVEPPAHTQPIGVVAGGSRFTLRRS